MSDAPFDPKDHNAEAVMAYVAANPDQAADILAAEEQGKARTTLIVNLQRAVSAHSDAEPEKVTAPAPKVQAKVVQVSGEFGPYDRYMEVATVRGIFGIAPGEVLVVPEDRGEKVTYRKA